MDIVYFQKVLIFLEALFAICASEVYLLRQPTYDDLKFDGYTLENLVNIGTLTSCAFRCVMNKRCVSLFYNKISKSCILKSVLFMKLQGGTVQSGTKYYSIYEEGCPEDFVRNREYDLCYKVFISPVIKDDAKNACATNGNVLLRGKTVDAYNHVSDQLLVTPGNGKGYYIGGSDAITDTRWLFDDGEEMTAFIWGGGEPDNNSNADFLYLRLNNGKYVMSDTVALVMANYICQKP